MSDHARVRAFGTCLVLCGLIACSGEAPAQPDAPAAPAPSAQPAAPAPAGAPDAVKSAVASIPATAPAIDPEHDLPPAEVEPEASADTTEAEAETDAVAADAPAADPEPPGDALDPILPDGPEPGSAAADAELLALLDESTLTQEEFAEGFGKGGPKLDGEQFVFGPGSRTRGTPVVRLGAVEGPAAKALAALVEADERKFSGCLAMGLSKDEGVTGSLKLRLRFDARGAVESVHAEELALGGAADIRESLTTCLRSIPAKWELSEAAGASASLPLTLTIEEA